MKNKILLIEDDSVLANTLKDFFEEEDFEVFMAENGQLGLNLFNKCHPDIILSDVQLPVKNGFELIKEIRKMDAAVPVILMTGSEMDTESQIRGYKLGALNYLLKPVSPLVVLAQVRALLKSATSCIIGNHQLLLQDQLFTVDQHQFIVREKDALVLDILIKNVNTIVARKQIVLDIWRNEQSEQHNLLDKTIARLRKALSEFPDIQIKSVYGNGYILTLHSSCNTSR